MRRLRTSARHARAAGAADRRRDRRAASATRCAPPGSAADRREAYIRMLRHARRRRAHLRSRPPARRRRSSSSSSRTSIRRARSTSDGVTVVARRRSCATIPGTVNPLIKSNNLLNNALAMQEALARGAFEGVMRNYRGELAECTHVEPVRRQERRRADAAARRRACCPGITREFLFEVGARAGDPGPRSGAATTTICSAPTKRSSPARRARSCRSFSVDDRTIGTGTPGPVTRALLEKNRMPG